jgi:hypothetical protein
MSEKPETSPWGAAGDIVAIYDIPAMGPANVELVPITKLTTCERLRQEHIARKEAARDA